MAHISLRFNVLGGSVHNIKENAEFVAVASKEMGPDVSGEELNDLYTSPNISRVIKWTRMRWAGLWHVWGRGQVYTGFGGILRERNHLKNAGTDGRIMLKWIFTKWDMGAWTGLICLRVSTGGGLL